MFPHQFIGHLHGPNGQIVERAGFRPGNLPKGGLTIIEVQGTPIVAPAANLTLERAAGAYEEFQQMPRETQQLTQEIARGEFQGDVNEALKQLAQQLVSVQRGVTSGMTAFPVRENLEAPARNLVPEETPIRNMLPRVPGAGLAAVWIQAVSLGGGWGTLYDQPGGASVKRLFYKETGSPVERTTTYIKRLAEYKLLGTLGSVSGFAMAAGANYMNQLATEKNNALHNMFLNEEMALLWGDAESVVEPWGDGTDALAFDGFMNWIKPANGTPSPHVQTSIGPLTTAHIDNQLYRIWMAGGRDLFIVISGVEAMSLITLLKAENSIYRLNITNQADTEFGFHVAKYIHPITGKPVDIIVDRFQIAGEMLFGAMTDVDGRRTAEVEVLPQSAVETAPEKPQQIQGYAVVDLARTSPAPDMHPFMISLYETLKVTNALVYATSSGVDPAP
jgi:hypothetical protein